MDDFFEFLLFITFTLAVTLGISALMFVILDEEGPCQSFGEEYAVTTIYENGECFVEENGQRFILDQYKYNKLQGVTVPSPSASN